MYQLAVGYAEYYNILVFAFALLIEKGHGEVFIEKFGNALRTGNKMGLYLLVKYVVFVRKGYTRSLNRPRC
jgi:hypothetical protein